MRVEFRNVNKTYTNTRVFKNLNLAFEDKKINCILGPSGCGKTTILNLIAGIQSIDSGEIFPAPPYSVSYLFQESRLLPWLKAVENAMYLMDKNLGIDVKKKNAMKLLQKVGLSGFEYHYPDELSGGMARRVSLVRAIAHSSDILLMDEPFASLDIKLKFKIVSLIKKLVHEKKRTTVCVTHDLDVAKNIGDRLIIINKNGEVTEVLDTMDMIHICLAHKNLFSSFYSDKKTKI
jgi:NitT/TauT family transport system ATP-binding protein